MKKTTVIVPEGAELEQVKFTAHLVAIASHYVSDMIISDKRNNIDLKSILGMMTLVMHAGKTFTIQINGSDEDAAEKAIVEFFNQRGE